VGAAGDGGATRDVGDPRGPIFFLSYARARQGKPYVGRPQDPDWPVYRLFDDLSMHVSQLVALPVGVDPGFMDRDMEGGTRWAPELLNAVGTCQVFVPLISALYLRSEWCAKEWDAFSHRTVRPLPNARSEHNSAILPVTWAPTTELLPPQVSEVLFFRPGRLADPDVVPRYLAEGVYGLLRMKDEPTYETVAWRLAQRIVDCYRAYRVDPEVPKDHRLLRTSFRGEGE
jgi:hypothetical protein